MPINNDLSREWRVATELEYHVSPVSIHDVEREVVDVGLLSFDVDDPSGIRTMNVPDKSRGTVYEDYEDPLSVWI